MKITAETTLQAPASAAWAVLGERFGEIAEWTTSLDSSHLEGELGVGAARVCAGPPWGPFPGGTMKEELRHFDRERRQLVYAATEGLPWFVRDASNRWTVDALDGERCRVRGDADVRLVRWLAPLGWLLSLAMRQPIRAILVELEAAVAAEAARASATTS